MAKKKIKSVNVEDVPDLTTEELLKEHDIILDSFSEEDQEKINIFSEIVRELTLREGM